jgi:hypothetical protein
VAAAATRVQAAIEPMARVLQPPVQVRPDSVVASAKLDAGWSHSADSTEHAQGQIWARAPE